jgi:hypothetical protein
MKIQVTPEEARAAAAAAGDTIERIVKVDANKDGKITFDEILTGMLAVYGSISTQLGSWKLAIGAIGEDDVRNAIVEGFADGFDIPNDTIENAVEQTIKTLDSIYDAVEAWQAVGNEAA